jgi:hypothetical protein
LASGYGSDIFALAHVGPNATRYVSWLAQSQTPVVVLALASPFVLSRPFAWLGLAWCAATLGVYLPYLVFEDWSYVRFLLPAVPVLTVLTLGTVAELVRRVAARRVESVLAVAAVLLVAAGARTAATQHVFELREFESVFPRSGDAIAMRLPGNALVVTSRYSGSVRYYGGRRTIVWDVLDPGSLDRVLSFARARGFVPYFLLDSGEEAAFRERFAGSASARLDWPPMIEIAPQVRVYSPDDRDRYLRGEARPTEFVR